MITQKNYLLYVLDGKIVRPCTDILEWGRFMKMEKRIIGKDKIGDKLVSTVFIGTDSGFKPGESLFFETIIFDKYGKSEDVIRYKTYDEALLGHNEAKLRASIVVGKQLNMKNISKLPRA